ncbi:thioesterase family protein [Sphingomonas donggukensis]|uniref:Thioesterase family protein n=1 Tax=Sphingomonas donggukensis TaxID=2949093 RepID=A0ABY4TVV3_9SPHN|nr:thioesterase family protein [Sphingomonas donggukensis]URW76523.1 thioesterase family protein [Sphingomonas donggukensis]
MTAIADILAAATPVEGGFRVVIPADWLQGRTAYGGLSSALALHAAKASDTDLPPLRSALIAFVGPLSGEVTVTAQRLRRGRNAAFVEATIVSDAGLGYRATFVFMSDVPSQFAHDTTVPNDMPPPAADAKLYTGPAEFFTGNFNFLDVKEGLHATEWLRWGRLREREGLDPETALIAVADALPPAALKLNGGKPAPVSSLTWIVNVLTPRPETRDGWWLLHATTDRAVGGYSSQRMTISNADGVPVVDAMQGVAVFA